LIALQLRTPRAFAPLLAPARYKGAHGGRGSGKSHFFAELLVERCLTVPGLRAVCIREVQKTLKESSKRLIEAKIQTLGVGHKFEVQHDQVKTPGGGLIIFQGMRDHSAESIKSLEGFDIAWVEEAQTLSAKSLELLRPTIRKANSELWFSWNPRFERDAVDDFMRGAAKPANATVVEANWRDNPWFGEELQGERRQDENARPDKYTHIWEGDYVQVYEGAYYAPLLLEAKHQGRMSTVSADPLLQLRAYWDIGGTGARADATAIWIAQFVGREIRVLDYYEAVGQPLAEHAHWLRSRGYGKALCVLPHDGAQHEKVERVTYESALKQAGFATRVLRNIGEGAAMKRIEAARRLLPMMWFNAASTQGGIAALKAYHEKRDAQRNIGLGPEHDWASHAADAFGALCVDYAPPMQHTTLNYSRKVR
jgi:phage terminase large subunit